MRIARKIVQEKINAFKAEFPGASIRMQPFRVTHAGLNTSQVKAFQQALHELRELNRVYRIAFAMEINVWPDYESRATGENATEQATNAEALLVEETSALLLSRILLLRFFEDYKYFDCRYLCNGGVKAFQEMRKHLKARYPALVKTAYAAGSEVYPSLFDASPLDWALRSNNDVFSVALEHAMMLLAEFNFCTIKEELLSSIYGVFFDEAQRKRRGEHYTPPSIARWMVRRAWPTNAPVKKMLDPACGFGTFVVGGWQELVGRVRERGGMTDVEAESAVTRICGNDLNSFSATLAQMQILWNLIQARAEERRHDPLPPLNISAGFDSLQPPDLFANIEEIQVTPWTDIDGDSYPLVAGNPPWVRPERRDFDPTAHQAEFFQEIGELSNIYVLFTYKALQAWIEPGGHLAFIIPLTFVDTKDGENLRKLFMPAPIGRWKLLEIVDFEVVKRVAFPAANVRPIIIIAEKTAAAADDEVKLRFVEHRHVELAGTNEVAEFKLDEVPVKTTRYANLFSPEGRIVLRCTTERTPLVAKLQALPTFAEVAFFAWDLRKGNETVERRLEKGDTPVKHRWEKVVFIKRGAVARRDRSPGNISVYKGENVLPCQIHGDVQDTADPRGYNDPSIWRFPDVLPEVGFAFARLTQFLVCAQFNPRTTCFFDTVTLFIPKKPLADVPFDLLVQSTPYRWYHLVALREGIIADYFCAVYPTTVERLPWHERIKERSADLRAVREEFLTKSRALFHARQILSEDLAALPTESLSERVERDEHLVIRWSDRGLATGELGFHRVQFGDDLFAFLEINDLATATQLKAVLAVFGEESLNQRDILGLRLPKPEGVENFNRRIRQYRDADRKQTSRTCSSDWTTLSARLWV